MARHPPTPRSAGLLLLAGRRLLVVERAPDCSNAGRWGLPGGRLRRGEAPFAAAHREAIEELGSLPPLEVSGRLRVRRPRAGRYDVFVCRAERDARRGWCPRLNREHTRYRWVRLEWLFAQRDRLHPVLRTVVERPDAVAALCRVLARRQQTLPAIPPRRRKQTIVIEGVDPAVGGKASGAPSAP